MSSDQPILETKNLQMYFPLETGIVSRIVGSKRMVKALDGVDVSVKEGETLGVVGESGCGKSTLARCLVRMYEPTGGEILFKGRNILKFGPKEMKEYRRKVQMIFQDPYSSLDPRVTVKNMLKDVLKLHRLGGTDQQLQEKMEALMISVGLDPAQLGRYPHEFSGGQRQRLCVARALAVEPEVIIADESVSALDVSIQAQTLNLFEELQKRLGLTMVFISHDLGVVEHISDRIVVMYLGKAVEVCGATELFNDPEHPYTQALISAVPVPDPDVKTNEIILKGDVPTAAKIPPGCRFHPRCQSAMVVCGEVEPLLLESRKDHLVACHLVHPVEAPPKPVVSPPAK